MKTSKIKTLAALFALVAMSATGQAQDLKIGYVNSERVLREASPAKAAQAKLEAEFSKRDRELNDQGAKLKAAAESSTRTHPRWPKPNAPAVSANWSSRTGTCSASAVSSRKT